MIPIGSKTNVVEVLQSKRYRSGTKILLDILLGFVYVMELFFNGSKIYAEYRNT